MKSILVRVMFVVFIVFLVSSVRGDVSIDAKEQQPQQQPPAETTPQRPASPFKAMVFDVKHKDPQALADALQPLMSGQPHTSMVPNRQMKTITVRDYPENISAIGEALRRLDVPDPPPTFKPRPPPSSIEFQLHLIAASPSAGEKTSFPASLEPVVNQLKSTLRFASYRYLTTFSNRVNEGGTIDAQGVISPPFPIAAFAQLKSGYYYQVKNPQLSLDAAGKEIIVTNSFLFKIDVPVETGISGAAAQFREVRLTTQLTLREGETAVVGTANAGSSDEAIIVVVSARKLK
jgi:hypothetical protein